MAVGDSAVSQMWGAVNSGQLEINPESAREVASAYFRFAQQCDGWLNNARELTQISGFGGIESAKQLQHGFATKASDLIDVLLQLKSATLSMAQAHLTAADILGEEDSLNAAAIKAVGQ
ncbi:hypothetical protein [Nocardia camponoti]|uniref:Uncharacterized protein n=1 Tax=Nocardia camponoti TaxID=1616106 RepID=A0A917QSC8_9NOCA|nr:hypothetical protein [Nocardia camponoti]GGK65605.1 hypothetical protein GCM10011591_42230 [Nocardia camponoti]